MGRSWSLDKNRDNFHWMQTSLVMSMRFIFGDDWNDALSWSRFGCLHRVQRRCVCLKIKTRWKPLKRWVILIALHFRYTFYRPQTKRLSARKIGLKYKIRPFFHSALRASVALRATRRAPPRIWLAVIDFQNGEQQIRSGSDKKQRNRLQ